MTFGMKLWSSSGYADCILMQSMYLPNCFLAVFKFSFIGKDETTNYLNVLLFIQWLLSTVKTELYLYSSYPILMLYILV